MGIFVFDVVKAFSDALTASITNVTNNLTDFSTDTTTNVANLQNFTISTQAAGARRPAWVAPYPIADVVYPDGMNMSAYVQGNTGTASAGTAHTHPTFGNVLTAPVAFTIVQNGSIGGYLTITEATVMDTVALYGVKLSGTLNNNFLEVFRENADTSLTRISSVDISASLTGTPAYIEAPLNATEIVIPGNRYMIRIRNSTSIAGSAGIYGLQRITLSPNVAFATTTSGVTNQTSYSASDAITAQGVSNVVPWAMIANTSGTVGDVSYSDDFNRTTLGNLWLLNSSWATQLGITSYLASYQGSTNGDQHGIYIRPTTGDNGRVDFDVTGTASASTHARCGGFMHANQDLSQMVYLGVTDNAVNIYSGASGSLTSRATISTTGNDGTWSLIYSSGSNTYTAYKGGVSVGLSWTDSGATVSHSNRHRFGGVRVSRVSSVNAGSVDNWTLRDYS